MKTLKKQTIISLLGVLILVSRSIFANPFKADKIVLDKAELISNSELVLYFTNFIKTVQIIPELNKGEERIIEFNEHQFPFVNKTINIKVKGEAKNLAEFIISELTTKGNVKKQDRIELCCITPGFSGGITINYNGNFITLPNSYVTAGEHIVLVAENGMSNNNGFVEVKATSNSNSRVMDKVIYTDSKKKNVKTNNSSSHWQGDGVDVTGSGTKKSICRKIINENGGYYYQDTDTAADFYITDKETFGSVNV